MQNVCSGDTGVQRKRLSLGKILVTQDIFWYCFPFDHLEETTELKLNTNFKQ